MRSHKHWVIQEVIPARQECGLTLLEAMRQAITKKQQMNNTLTRTTRSKSCKDKRFSMYSGGGGALILTAGDFCFGGMGARDFAHASSRNKKQKKTKKRNTHKIQQQSPAPRGLQQGWGTSQAEAGTREGVVWPSQLPGETAYTQKQKQKKNTNTNTDKQESVLLLLMTGGGVSHWNVVFGWQREGARRWRMLDKMERAKKKLNTRRTNEVCSAKRIQCGDREQQWEEASRKRKGRFETKNRECQESSCN